MRKLTTEVALSIMSKARPDYDYSKFTYTGTSHKSTVICEKHGDFTTTYDRIKNGHG